MMERYGIKDLTLFTDYGVTGLYFQLRMSQVEQEKMKEVGKKNLRIFYLEGHD